MQAALNTTMALIGVWVRAFTLPIHSGSTLSNDMAIITRVPPKVMFVNHIQNQAKNRMKITHVNSGLFTNNAVKNPKNAGTGSGLAAPRLPAANRNWAPTRSTMRAAVIATITNEKISAPTIAYTFARKLLALLISPACCTPQAG